MSVCVDVCMSKMMRMPIKVGVWKYATNANCQTLLDETLSFYTKTPTNVSKRLYSLLPTKNVLLLNWFSRNIPIKHYYKRNPTIKFLEPKSNFYNFCHLLNYFLLVLTTARLNHANANWVRVASSSVLYCKVWRKLWSWLRQNENDFPKTISIWTEILQLQA